jgi:hypothetical protein
MTPDDFPAGGYVGDYLSFWLVWLGIAAATWLFFRGRRGRPGLLRLIAGNLLVFALLLWTVVVAAETYLRYVYDGTDTFSLMLTHRSWNKRHLRFNRTGLFRDRDFEDAKAPGVVRVACVGDSFTMAQGVADAADAWPQRVGAGLEARAPGAFDVRNYGVSGYTTRHELQLIEGLAHGGGIDRIVLGYCLNDADDLLPPDRWLLVDQLPRVPWVRPTWSFVADFLWYRTRLATDPRIAGRFDDQKEAYEDPDVWGRQTAQFRRIVETCRAASVRLDVVVFPFFSQWGEGYPFDGCHDLVAQAWRELGVNVIDLRDAYRGVPAEDLVVNRFDAHPNERAQEIAARAVLERAFGAK